MWLSTQDPPECRVVLEWVEVKQLCFRHQWKTFNRSDLGKHETHVTLCSQCKQVLVKEGRGHFKMKDVWPVYMWLLVTNKQMQKVYGADAIHFIPRQWWKYWKVTLSLELPGIYSDQVWKIYEDSVCVIED